MNRLTREALWLAVGLAALAGFVDATGFLQLRGYFVSFMSGNSTQLAVAAAHGAWPLAATLGGIIALFVVGNMMGTLIGLRAGPRLHVPVMLGSVGGLLLAAGACHAAGWNGAAVGGMTLAMGVENAVFQRDGDIVVGLTYMTGTLAKLGQKLALALGGGERFAWLPHLGLWLGLVAGGVLGALDFAWIGLDGLWIATAGAAALTLTAGLKRIRV